MEAKQNHEKKKFRLLKNGLYFLYLIFMVFLIMEVAFRYQIIDFYTASFRALNPKKPLPSSKNILVFGDSFLAHTPSFLDSIQIEKTDYQFINCAVSGIGIKETNCIAYRKTKEYPPSAIIYQIYLGNDLWDIRKKWNTQNISYTRNIYWKISNYSLFLRYFNYRLGQFKKFTKIGIDMERKEMNIKTFSAKKYSERERVIFSAEPNLIENSVFLENGREKDMEILVEGIEKMIQYAENQAIPVYILLIPHCAQVNSFYKDNMQQIGATFSQKNIFEPNYPFVSRLQTHFSANKNVKILNPLTYFQANDTPENRLYYANDPHLNDNGHIILAKWLKESLQADFK